LDILQNCQGSEIEARKQILFLFGGNEANLDKTEPNSSKQDSWKEIPQINDLDQEYRKPKGEIKMDFTPKKEEYIYRDQTTEHINSFLYGPKNDSSELNYSLTEKDPPENFRISKKKTNKKKKTKKRRKKKFYKVESDSEDDLIYDNIKKESSITETLSNETRESMSKQMDDFQSEYSSVNFSTILDDLEGPEMTCGEKEELLKIMKNDYKDSWDEHDQKSFVNAYVESQMVEDMVRGNLVAMGINKRKKPRNIFWKG
jgi:hypothetical protein